ncbi:MAG: NifU family protein [Acidimicrobiales bacterium]
MADAPAAPAVADVLRPPGGSGRGRLSDAEAEEVVEQLEALLGRVEAMAGPDGEAARAAVSALAEVYGEALARAVAVAREVPEAVACLSADPLVGHLMALHGLHPGPPEARARQAVSEVQGLLGATASVSLAGVHDGVAEVRVSPGGCGSARLKAAVRDIVLTAAPELSDVEAVDDPPVPAAFIPLQAVRRRRPKVEGRI